MPTIKIKRIYEPVEKSDGMRILVDRLWPRGIKKEDAHIDLWMKEVAPSTALRKWFNHEPGKWQAFSKHYEAELALSSEAADLAGQLKDHKIITLLYGAKDELHNQAVVLRQFLYKKLAR